MNAVRKLRWQPHPTEGIANTCGLEAFLPTNYQRLDKWYKPSNKVVRFNSRLKIIRIYNYNHISKNPLLPKWSASHEDLARLAFQRRAKKNKITFKPPSFRQFSVNCSPIRNPRVPTSVPLSSKLRTH